MPEYKIRIDCDSPQWLYIPDVEYKKYGDISRKLQMIVPYATDKKYPLIVYLPGSAFYRQEMYNSVPEFGKLAERGFVVAALQYRESQIAKFPAQIEDVHNAITFLKAKAEEFHIDFDHIFIMGHSSGAYNSLMAGVTEAEYRISGVIACSAPSYLSYEPEVLDAGLTDYKPEDYRPELDMLGIARFEDDMALFHRARVATYVTPQREIPPILLIHGNRDGDVTVENSRKLYRELTVSGKDVTYYELTGQGHGGAWLWDKTTLDIAAEFCRRYT